MKQWILAGLMASTIGLTAEEMTKPPMTDITPLAGPRVHNWAEFFVSADFIYWQARQDNLQFAEDGNFNYDGVGGFKKGRTLNPDFGFEPGFKAGIGVNFRHDGWDLYANYTWLEQNDAHNSVSENSDYGQLFSLWQIAPSGIFVSVPTAISQASANWKLHFNAIDLELGRNFYISNHLALRPHFGLKGARNKQVYVVKSTLIPNGVFLADSTFLHSETTQHFWGIGLRAGLNSEWHFTRNWSIYGTIALSELYGQFKDVRKDDATDLTTGAASTAFYAGKSFHTIKPVLEMSLGLRYETFFSADRYMLFLQAGWEEQIWFSQNQFINMTDHLSGDLVMQGLDIKFGFSF